MGEWTQTTLSRVLSFSNGRSSPTRSDSLPYAVYGSNGIIGLAGETNADANSIVIGRVGSYCGSLYFSKQKCWITDNAIRANAIDDNDVKFLFYLLQTLNLNHWRAGSGQPLLNQTILGSIPTSVPEPKEQRAIASLLGALDDKIDLNRRTNKELEVMAQLFFKDWFVDFGPTRAKAEGRPPYLTAEIWSLFPDTFDDEDKPVGWMEKRVEDVLELAYGKALKANERITGSIPVYGSGGVTGYHNEYLVDGPSVIVGRKGTVGSLYWEDRSFFPIDTVFYVNPKAPLTFCYYLLQTLGLDGMNTDAAVPGLNRNNVYRLPVTWSCDELLEAFNTIVNPLRSQIFSNIEESRILAQTRDMLLPKFMSGEISLRDAEKSIEDAL